VRFEDRGGRGRFISVLPVEEAASVAEKRPEAPATN
jgi:hypothetical protein